MLSMHIWVWVLFHGDDDGDGDFDLDVVFLWYFGDGFSSLVSIGNEVTEAAQTTTAPSVTTYIDIDLTKTKALQGAINNTRRVQDVRASG